MQAFADHGEVEGDQVTGTADEAREVIDALEALGISYDDVVERARGRGRRQVRQSPGASWSETVKTALDGAKAEGCSRERSRRHRSPTRPNPLRDPLGPADAPDRRTLRPGDLRCHRRPVDQEADAGGLRPGQPRSAAARLRPGRLRPAGVGAPGLRPDRARRRPAARPHPVPRGGVAAAVGGHPVRAGRDRRRRLRSTSCGTRSSSWTRPAAPAATTPSTCPSRRDCSRPWSTSSASTGWPSSTPGQWSRVVIEKPFGHDLASAQELNRVVSSVFPSSSVFRIDHYLGKETVQNLLALRFANQLFEPVWNNNYVDHVQITMAEDIGIGGRAGYFDGIGIARDVIQNHLLQLLALTAMEEPTSFEAAQLRAEKQKVLAAARPPERMDLHTARGRYRGGWQGGEKVAGYLEEKGIPADHDHRDLRGDPGRHRQPALGRGAVLPADRQAAGPTGDRDRARLQAGAAPAVHRHRHRGARLQRPGAADPARRGRDAAVRRQGARHADGDPRGEHGLRVRRLVHRVVPGGVRAVDPGRAARRPAAVPAARGGRAVLADPGSDPGLLGEPGQPARGLRTRRLGTDAAPTEMLARDGHVWRRP